jgi:hypothetical protein
VVVEQLPVVVAKVLFWAFADAIDKIAIATPAMKSDAVFMTISSPKFRDSRCHPGTHDIIAQTDKGPHEITLDFGECGMVRIAVRRDEARAINAPAAFMGPRAPISESKWCGPDKAASAAGR